MAVFFTLLFLLNVVTSVALFCIGDQACLLTAFASGFLFHKLTKGETIQSEQKKSIFEKYESLN